MNISFGIQTYKQIQDKPQKENLNGEFSEEIEKETFRRDSGMQVPVGLPGFTIVTSFGTGLLSDNTFSNQSEKSRKFKCIFKQRNQTTNGDALSV